MIVQFEVLGKIVKRMNIWAICAIIIYSVGYVLSKIIFPGITIPQMFIILFFGIGVFPVFIFILRYLYLSYAYIDEALMKKPKYDKKYFVISMILPFVSIAVPPFYFVDLAKNYGIQQNHKLIYQITLILYIVWEVMGALSIIGRKSYYYQFDNQYFSIFHTSIGVILALMIFVFINTMLRNQKIAFATKLGLAVEGE